MLNAISVDVEDYYMVTAFASSIKRSEWDNIPSRIRESTAKTLDLLGETKATFFVLGYVAAKHPDLVNRIAQAGHEIASHGYDHRLVYHMTPDEFRRDVRTSKDILEQTIGRQVTGYRAPSYSITAKTPWAFDILKEEAFSYDSSIFPIIHDTYGIPDAPRFPYDIPTSAGALKEFPLSTTLFSRHRIPISGGGYLRFFPLAFTQASIRRVNEIEGMPIVLYFHPWELDTDQPRVRAPVRSMLRHYVNLGSTEKKIRRLVSFFSFAPLRTVLGIS